MLPSIYHPFLTDVPDWQPVNTRRRMRHNSDTIVKWITIYFVLSGIVIFTELVGLINIIPPIWPIIVLIAIGHLLSITQNMYMHLSNRFEILYLMRYEFMNLAPDNIKSAINLVAENQKRFQHLISHYLYGHYDLGGLIPPPRNTDENYGLKENLVLPEARYLLRTLDDTEWKKTISAMISRSKAFIVECNSWSESLSWEVSEIIRLRGLKKLILIADEGSLESAKENREKIISIAKEITNRKTVKVPELMVHRKLKSLSVGQPDTNFATKLIKRVYEISPASSEEKAKMLHIARKRLGLGLSGMFSFLLAVLYTMYLLYNNA